MKKEFRIIHNEMLENIQRTMKSGSPESQRADSCCWITVDYWNKLKIVLKKRGFKDDKDEIDFFRNVKPRFTSYIEYMMLLREALYSVPAEINNATDYWTKEIDRFKLFYNNNIDFIVYYGRKDWHYNSIYFLRRNNKSDNSKSAHPYDADPEYCTSHDPIIASYLAHKMYAKYARKKLWALTRDTNTNKETKIISLPGMDKLKKISNG